MVFPFAINQNAVGKNVDVWFGAGIYAVTSAAYRPVMFATSVGKLVGS